MADEPEHSPAAGEYLTNLLDLSRRSDVELTRLHNSKAITPEVYAAEVERRRKATLADKWRVRMVANPTTMEPHELEEALELGILTQAAYDQEWERRKALYEAQRKAVAEANAAAAERYYGGGWRQR